jgi:hypothetical protein
MGGSKEAEEFARTHQKPLLHIHSQTFHAASLLRDFVIRNRIEILNIAGPRASSEPAVGGLVTRVLDEAFT